MADGEIDWGICMQCQAQVRWVRTVAGVEVPVSVTARPGGALVPVAGQRRVQRRGPADGGRPGFVPHWEECDQPGAWSAERAALAAGAPNGPARLRSSQLGRCAGCYRPDHIAYGPECTGTLCADCSAVLAAWRKTPAAQRGPLKYPRWKGQ